MGLYGRLTPVVAEASTFASPFATGRLRRTGWRTGSETQNLVIVLLFKTWFYLFNWFKRIRLIKPIELIELFLMIKSFLRLNFRGKRSYILGLDIGLKT